MELEVLKRIYGENEVVQAICDHMADRSKNQNETTLHRIIYYLEQEDYDFKKSEIIAAFRQLEEAGCGRYVEGRRGWRSRFVWKVKSLFVAGAASGSQSENTLDADDDEEDVTEYEENFIEHSYALRPDLTVSIELPEDLTQNEAHRLAQFVDSLSFEE